MPGLLHSLCLPLSMYDHHLRARLSPIGVAEVESERAPSSALFQKKLPAKRPEKSPDEAVGYNPTASFSVSLQNPVCNSVRRHPHHVVRNIGAAIFRSGEVAARPGEYLGSFILATDSLLATCFRQLAELLYLLPPPT
ncbi:Uncharacterised protein r2_g740 [Pycnogonum litorale]